MGEGSFSVCQSERLQQAVPENEYEKNEQGEEGGDVVHRLEHDEQLVAKCRQKADQLQDAQQTERP